jgi:copper chaperone NosL
MDYQPPLIGSRKLLNFTATSWPGLGGWIAIASSGLGVFAVFRELQGARQRSARSITAELAVRVPARARR